jgi:hypothetical protein
MKSNNLDFKEFIISEAKSIAKESGFNIELKENFKSDEVSESKLNIEDDFEEVNVEELAKESREAKNLSEEVSRMKDLLNFNNPLLKN